MAIEIVDLPIENKTNFHSYASLPEGITNYDKLWFMMVNYWWLLMVNDGLSVWVNYSELWSVMVHDGERLIIDG